MIISFFGFIHYLFCNISCDIKQAVKYDSVFSRKKILEKERIGIGKRKNLC